MLMPNYEPMQLVGDYTAKHIPGIINKVLIINLLLLTSVLFMPNSLAPIMAKKRISFPVIGGMIYLLVMLILDNKNVLMELEDRCP